MTPLTYNPHAGMLSGVQAPAGDLIDDGNGG